MQEKVEPPTERGVVQEAPPLTDLTIFVAPEAATQLSLMAYTDKRFVVTGEVIRFHCAVAIWQQIQLIKRSVSFFMVLGLRVSVIETVKVQI